jgi:cbb3-type cytochrome oxidase subunit 3
VPYTFLGVTLTENLNQMSFDWITLVFLAIRIGYAAFLLRPSKCKQIQESLCFAEKESAADAQE